MQTSTRGILRFALPVMFSFFAEFAITFADTAFLGHIGTYEINLAGTSGLIHLCLLMVLVGLSYAGQILVGRYRGDGDLDRALALFLPILVPLIFFGIITTLVFTVFPTNWIHFLVEDPRLAEGIQHFLEIRGFGFIPAAISMSFISYLLGHGHSRALLWSTAAITITNVGLDYMFIFGVGFPEQGVLGAARASVIAEIVGMIVLSLFAFQLFGKQLFKRPQKFWKETITTFKLGLPLMVQKFLSVGAWTLFFLAVEKTGEFNLAVSQILRSLYYLTLIPVMAMGVVTKTYISYFSAKSLAEFKGIRNKLYLISLALTLVFVHGYFLYPTPLISILTDNQELVNHAVPILKWLVGAMFVFSVAHITFCCLEGLGYTRISFLVELISIGFYLGWVYVLIQDPGVTLWEIWMVDYLYFGIMAFCSWAFLAWVFKWKRKEWV